MKNVAKGLALAAVFVISAVLIGINAGRLLRPYWRQPDESVDPIAMPAKPSSATTEEYTRIEIAGRIQDADGANGRVWHITSQGRKWSLALPQEDSVIRFMARSLSGRRVVAKGILDVRGTDVIHVERIEPGGED